MPLSDNAIEEIIRELNERRQRAIDNSKIERVKGNTEETQFQLGLQCAFLGAENIIRKYQLLNLP